MHYKKTLALFVTLAIPLLFTNFTYLKSAGAHPGATGAPGDVSCADVGCHTGNVVANDTKVNTLIFPTLDSTYVAGQTYLVKIKVNNPGIQRFGFQIASLYEATDKNAGTFAVTEPGRTQLLTHTVNNDTRYEITHTQGGNSTSTPGTTEWTVNWTAPVTAQGNIILYYATNSANNDGERTGDNICLSAFRLKPLTPAGIDEIINANEITAFYNNNNNSLELNYSLKKQSIIKTTIVSISGQVIYSGKEDQKRQGLHHEVITLPNDASSGIYYVNIQYENKQVTKKLFIK